MDVLFQPRYKPKEEAPEALAQCLNMTVLHNQFDATVFRLSGSCVSHDVVFENLPGDSVADELGFDQVYGRPTVRWFRVGNENCVAHCVRFMILVYYVNRNEHR